MYNALKVCFRLGMHDNQANEDKLLKSICKGLAGKPDLAQRIDSILKLANEPTSTGRIRSADEVEELLVQELRKLGNESISGWAQGVDKRVGDELKQEEPTVKKREKKR